MDVIANDIQDIPEENNSMGSKIEKMPRRRRKEIHDVGSQRLEDFLSIIIREERKFFAILGYVNDMVMEFLGLQKTVQSWEELDI